MLLKQQKQLNYYDSLFIENLYCPINLSTPIPKKVFFNKKNYLPSFNIFTIWTINIFCYNNNQIKENTINITENVEMYKESIITNDTFNFMKLIT